VTGGIQVDESGVYVSSTDRRLYVLDTDTGSRIHTHRLPGPLCDTPTVVQRTVYQYCQGDGLFAFDVDTRQRLWRNPDARRFIARAAEDLVLMTVSGDLMFADNVSGQVRHVVDLPEGVTAVRNSRDAVLYLVAPDGRVLCAKPRRFPYLRREAVTRARAQLHLHPRAIQESLGDSATNPSIAGSSPSNPTADPLRSRIR
jgi:hypothetical protein